jgi:hypothetical protein
VGGAASWQAVPPPGVRRGGGSRRLTEGGANCVCHLENASGHFTISLLFCQRDWEGARSRGKGGRHRTSGLPSRAFTAAAHLRPPTTHLSTLRDHGDQGTAAAFYHCPHCCHHALSCRSADRGTGDYWMVAAVQRSLRCHCSAASMAPRRLLLPSWAQWLCKLQRGAKAKRRETAGLLSQALLSRLAQVKGNKQPVALRTLTQPWRL